MTIEKKLTASLKKKPSAGQSLGFGKIFTDYMFVMDYDTGPGWHNPRIEPYAPIALEPSASIFHYGQSIFEGLKAYKTGDGRVLLFRPEKNIARMNESCRRMCIPELDGELALKAIRELVEIEKDWIPADEDASLYIRPFVFAVDPQVGVKPADHLKFMIILSPVGAYYDEGLAPVKIFVEDDYVRAVRGGTGFIKAGANYAISLKAQAEAAKQGYSQVLWLDGIERKYVEEVGAMNVFFIFEDEIVAPALNGSILPGVTRISVIELLKSWGKNITERKLSIDEIAEAAGTGKLLEAFGSGTAAVISPIGELKWNDRIMSINNGEIGALTQRLYDTLTGIQWGRIKDEFGWTLEI